MGINRTATSRQSRIDTLRAFQITESEAQRAEGIFDEFAICAWHFLQVAQPTRVGCVYQFAVEQREERADTGFILGLLEEGPPLLVERLLMEGPGRPTLDDGLVSRLGLWPALGHEQRLGAAKPGFVHQRTLRMLRHQPCQRRRGFIRLTVGIQSSCQLVKHGVIPRITGISLQQTAI